MELTARPISLSVDPDSRTVFTTARGILRIDDFIALMRELANAGVFAYPHLMDARESKLQISPGDVRTLVSLNRELRSVHGHARTAFVARNPADFGMMRMYELIIGENDPGFAVFYDITDAEQWIFSK